MSIKYDIRSIHNSEGKGEERKYVGITDHSPMTADQLAGYIQGCCSLTKGDVKAALSALRDCLIRELSSGNRFYIPEIGYFSLAVDARMPEGITIEQVKGNHVQVSGIKFRPEASLLREMKHATSFERDNTSHRSKIYTEAELLEKIHTYLSTHRSITRRTMETEFGLLGSTARKWLKHFADTGALRKEGPRNSPVYLPA